MAISRTDEYERVIDNSTIADTYAIRLNAYNSGNNSINNSYSSINKKMSVEEYVSTLINRAGMSEYIKMVNSQVDTSRTKKAGKASSLLEIPKIKESVDTAINSGNVKTTFALLANIEGQIRFDDQIPAELKNVMGDTKLKNYISERINKNDKDFRHYDFSGNKPIDNPTDRNNSEILQNTIKSV